MFKVNSLNFKHFFSLIFLVLVSFPMSPWAKSGSNVVVSPEVIEGTTRVDADGLIRAVNSMENLVLIDSRIRRDRKYGYIEGSINLPDEVTTCRTLARHTKIITNPVLFYCNGPKCVRSANAAQKTIACGYKQVLWFRGGIEEWTKKDYPLVRDN